MLKCSSAKSPSDLVVRVPVAREVVRADRHPAQREVGPDARREQLAQHGVPVRRRQRRERRPAELVEARAEALDRLLRRDPACTNTSAPPGPRRLQHPLLPRRRRRRDVPLRARDRRRRARLPGCSMLGAARRPRQEPRHRGAEPMSPAAPFTTVRRLTGAARGRARTAIVGRSWRGSYFRAPSSATSSDAATAPSSSGRASRGHPTAG